MRMRAKIYMQVIDDKYCIKRLAYLEIHFKLQKAPLLNFKQFAWMSLEKKEFHARVATHFVFAVYRNVHTFAHMCIGINS